MARIVRPYLERPLAIDVVRLPSMNWRVLLSLLVLSLGAHGCYLPCFREISIGHGGAGMIGGCSLSPGNPYCPPSEREVIRLIMGDKPIVKRKAPLYSIFAEIPVGMCPQDIAFSPDGKRAWVSFGISRDESILLTRREVQPILVLDMERVKKLEIFSLGKYGDRSALDSPAAGAIAVSDDGKIIYAIEGRKKMGQPLRVFILDSASGTLLGKFEFPETPDVEVVELPISGGPWAVIMKRKSLEEKDPNLWENHCVSLSTGQNLGEWPQVDADKQRLLDLIEASEYSDWEPSGDRRALSVRRTGSVVHLRLFSPEEKKFPHRTPSRTLSEGGRRSVIVYCIAGMDELRVMNLRDPLERPFEGYMLKYVITPAGDECYAMWSKRPTGYKHTFYPFSVFDLETGEEKKRFEVGDLGRSVEVESVHMTPDGRYLVLLAIHSDGSDWRGKIILVRIK